MKRLAMILGMFTLLLVSLAHAQQRWERTYGGADYDHGRSVQQTQDGGYVVAGGTYSFGNQSQVYLIKTNASGDTLWTRTYGGTDVEVGYSIQQTTDMGYIVAGYTNSFVGFGSQAYLVKTNATGDTLWTRTYGDTNNDYGRSVQQTSDGGYIIAGFTDFGNYNQVYLIKTNSSGDTLWTRHYWETDYNRGNFVQQTSDGGYIVAGEAYSLGSVQVYLVKTNASGDTLWTRTYGGADYDYGYSVQQTSDGGFIVVGEGQSFGNRWKVYLIKTNASGDTLWTRTYGGTSDEGGNSVQQTLDGGYIVTGWAWSFGNQSQVYLVKANASGDTLWTRTYGGPINEVGKSIQQTTDRGYIIAGWTNSYGNWEQVYLIKTDSLGRSTGVEESKGFEGTRVQGFKITPNPFTSFATLPGHEGERFRLYDVSGRKVGTYKGDRVGEGLAPGVYFLRSSDSQDRPLRIVKVR
jgi:hypothetical protein